MHSRLKTIRKTLNLNQDKFSKKLGISQTYYSDIERGTKGISSTVFISLDKLGINLHWFISGKGEIFGTGNGNFLKSLDPSGDIATAINLLSKMSEDNKKDCLKYIQEKTLLQNLQESK